MAILPGQSTSQGAPTIPGTIPGNTNIAGVGVASSNTTTSNPSGANVQQLSTPGANYFPGNPVANPANGTIPGLTNIATQLGNLSSQNYNLPSVTAPKIPYQTMPSGLDLGQILAGLEAGVQQKTQGSEVDAKSLFAQAGLSDSTMLGQREQQIANQGFTEQSQVASNVYGMAIQQAQMNQQVAMAQAAADYNAQIYNADNVFKGLELSINSQMNALGLETKVILANIDATLKQDSVIGKSLSALMGATMAM